MIRWACECYVRCRTDSSAISAECFSYRGGAAGEGAVLGSPIAAVCRINIFASVRYSTQGPEHSTGFVLR